LKETVPMDGSSLIIQTVMNLYFNPVAPVCLDSRPRKLSIYHNNTTGNSVWGQLFPADGKVVMTSDTYHKLASNILGADGSMAEYIPV
jgi:hypothetical protein